MPDADNNGLRIYYEVEGDGPPLVLAHGFTTSLEGWRTNGYAEALSPSFQLVMFDARGHGRSDKPHTPAAYTQTLMAGDRVDGTIFSVRNVVLPEIDAGNAIAPSFSVENVILPELSVGEAVAPSFSVENLGQP